MKKYILPLVLVAALTGCESIYLPTLKEVPVYPTNRTQSDDGHSGSYHLASGIGRMFPKSVMKPLA